MLVPHDMHMELPKYDRWDNGTQSAWFEQKRVFRFHFVHGIFMLNIDLSLSMAIIFVFIMYHDFIFRYYITMTFYCHVKKGYVKVYRQVFARLMTISFFFFFSIWYMYIRRKCVCHKLARYKNLFYVFIVETN